MTSDAASGFKTSTRIAARTARGERAPPAAPSVVPAFARHQDSSRGAVGTMVGARVAVGDGDGPVGWGVGNVGYAQSQLEHAHVSLQSVAKYGQPAQSTGAQVPPPRPSQVAEQSITGGLRPVSPRPWPVSKETVGSGTLPWNVVDTTVTKTDGGAMKMAEP